MYLGNQCCYIQMQRTYNLHVNACQLLEQHQGIIVTEWMHISVLDMFSVIQHACFHISRVCIVTHDLADWSGSFKPL